MANERDFTREVFDARKEMSEWPKWLKQATRLEGRRDAERAPENTNDELPDTNPKNSG